jgi:hypothetical protein
MKAPKFKSGETVTVVASRYMSNAHGRFTVERRLPEEHGEIQYRIKSVTDGHSRVVMECEIA